MKKILIIGGQGFIGSHITNAALKMGFQVTIISPFLQDFSYPVSNVQEITILYADITSHNSVEKVLKGKQFNYVINCAGFIDHQLFKDGGKSVIDQHFIGVMNIVQCLNRDRLESFIQIGSSDEYGNLNSPQKEDLREASISPYSFGKTATTHFLQMLYRTENFPVTILRFFLIYGPGQNNQRFVPQIITGCLEAPSFPVSEGKQLRDFCYVKDIADGVISCCLNDKVKGEILNLASGEAISIKKMINTIKNIIGAGNPKFGEIPYRIGENMELFADIEKARKLLNWNPTTPLKEGLLSTFDYYKNSNA